MKLYVVLKSIVNRRDDWSLCSDRIEKIFDKREKAEEYVSSEKEKSIPGYYYKSIYTILEHDVETLEQEKCELLGMIQGKDKVIQELKKENEDLKQKTLVLHEGIFFNKPDVNRRVNIVDIICDVCKVVCLICLTLYSVIGSICIIAKLIK